MELRIHHFFDIIRDFGSGKEIKPHSHGHSYHLVAEMIRKDPYLKIKLVVRNDHVCKACSYLKDDHCVDTIAHRSDFISKEAFNNHLDRRIMEACLLEEGHSLTIAELCEKASLYLGNFEWIYYGNDQQHTEIRKKNVILGLKYYKEKHSLD